MEELKKGRGIDGTEGAEDFVPVGQTEPALEHKKSDAVVAGTAAEVGALDVLPDPKSLPQPTFEELALRTSKVGTPTELPNELGTAVARNK